MSGRRICGDGINRFVFHPPPPRARMGPARLAGSSPGPVSFSTPALCPLGLPLQHPVENTVDEPAGLSRAVSFGQFQSLVDGDLGGDLRTVEHLVCAEAQDVPIDGGHAVKPPVFGDHGYH